MEQVKEEVSNVGPDVPALRRVSHFDVLREVPDAEVLLVAVGPLAGQCLAAAEELASHDVRVNVVDPRWTAPLDPHLVKYSGRHRLVLAVEDTTSTGALGARLGQALTGSSTCVATFALPPRFLPHDSRARILRAHGLDAAGITTSVLKRLALK